MKNPEITTQVIAEIPKKDKERLSVALAEYGAWPYVNLRMFFLHGHGAEWRPGKQGVTVRLDMLGQLIEALQEAKVMAEQQGMYSRVEEMSGPRKQKGKPVKPDGTEYTAVDLLAAM